MSFSVLIRSYLSRHPLLSSPSQFPTDFPLIPRPLLSLSLSLPERANPSFLLLPSPNFVIKNDTFISFPLYPSEKEGEQSTLQRKRRKTEQSSVSSKEEKNAEAGAEGGEQTAVGGIGGCGLGPDGGRQPLQLPSLLADPEIGDGL